MSGQHLLRVALDAGAFPTISARRLRNMVIEAFAPRYLVNDAQPARVLKDPDRPNPAAGPAPSVASLYLSREPNPGGLRV
jgi:hypothetical protein